jgi:hypothetical protein
VLAHDQRADQGNPEITVWCPKCEERVVALRNGTCGWCNTKLDLTRPAPEPAAAVPPRTPAARDELAEREDIEVTLWRRNEIFEWVLAEGPKTIVEIKDRFELPQNTAATDVAALRAEGRLERTGAERQGPRGGRPSAEYRAVTAELPASEPPVPDELLGAAGELVDDEGEEKSIGERISERRDLGWTVDPTPFGDRPGASEHTRAISEEVRHQVEALYQADDEQPVDAPITVHEQLVVHYVSALIGWVERSAFVRDQGPPDHVFDRIERLLQIQDGAA